MSAANEAGQTTAKALSGSAAKSGHPGHDDMNIPMLIDVSMHQLHGMEIRDEPNWHISTILV